MKKCKKCGILKSLDEFCKDNRAKDGKHTYCKKCMKETHKNYYYNRGGRETKKDYYNNRGGREKAGRISMYENKSCPQYLGIVVAERLIRHLYNDVKVMPFGFPGYDFICNKGKKINAKASTAHIRKNKNSTVESWKFEIKKNKKCDFFLSIAFDSVNNPNPLHMWMIPGNEVNDRVGIQISSSTIHRWDKWKMNINDAQLCCMTMKEKEIFK